MEYVENISKTVGNMAEKVNDIAINEELTNEKVSKLEDEMASLVSRVGSIENHVSSIDGRTATIENHEKAQDNHLTTIKKDMKAATYGWSYIGRGFPGHYDHCESKFLSLK